MLLEWLQAWLMPASFEARRLGAVHELVAVRARARRQDSAWADHRAKAVDAVRRVIDGMEAAGVRHELAVVLGSGWLLEVPLEDLSRRFERVLLVDLVIPGAVRRRARRLGNVDCLAHDVTGVYAPLAHHPLSPPVVPNPAPLPDAALGADLVFSSNLLSQLPVSPGLWMERHGQSEDSRMAVSEELIAAHLAALEGCEGSVCLLSDFEREERDRSREGGAIRYDLLHGARPKVDGPRWWWSLAPEGEEGKTLSVRHRVMCGVLAKAGSS